MSSMLTRLSLQLAGRVFTNDNGDLLASTETVLDVIVPYLQKGAVRRASPEIILSEYENYKPPNGDDGTYYIEVIPAVIAWETLRYVDVVRFKAALISPFFFSFL